MKAYQIIVSQWWRLIRVNFHGFLSMSENQNSLKASDFALPTLVTLVVSYVYLSLHLDSFYPSNWVYPTEHGFRILKQEVGWGSFGVNKSVQGKKLLVGGASIEFGFGVHGPSELEILPVREGNFLRGSCALEDTAGNVGAIRCSIIQNGLLLWSSSELTESAPVASFLVPFVGRYPLQLILTSTRPSIEGAHGVWYNLNVL